MTKLKGDLAPQGIFPRSEGKTLVIFGEYVSGVSEVCKTISKDLSCPVFYLHVHDDDLWMYEFFVGGEVVDRFNTTPDYWSEIDEQEEKKWKGDVDVIVRHWPDANADAIRRYLVNHTKDKIEPEAKAYKTDKFQFWDCWQVADFMEKLGVSYPDTLEDETPASSIQFRFDSDSLLLVGLGFYGLSASTRLNGGVKIAGFLFAGFLLGSGVLGFFMKKPARVAGAVLMLMLGGFGVYHGVTLGFDLSLVIIVLCAIGGSIYFVKEYKELK